MARGCLQTGNGVVKFLAQGTGKLAKSVADGGIVCPLHRGLGLHPNHEMCNNVGYLGLFHRKG